MRFAYRKELATEPLARALAQRGWMVTAVDRPADALLDGTADIVLTPALDYARNVGVSVAAGRKLSGGSGWRPAGSPPCLLSSYCRQPVAFRLFLPIPYGKLRYQIR